MPTPPLPPAWTLTCQGVTLNAGTAGVTDLIRRRASQATDRCVVRAAGRALDAPALFPFGSTVTIRRGSATWFVGRVTAVPGSGDGRGESQDYELSGPWWYLEHLVCRQEWKFQGGEVTGLLSRLILGQGLDGSRLTTGQVILETLHYAIDSGAPFAIGTIDPEMYAPLDEVREVTCAEVLRKTLRWHPDCAAWFDYSTAGLPTFHCRARSQLDAAVLTVGQAPLSAVRAITARHDLQTPAVVIHYELTGRTNGVPHTDVFTDAAPEGATGREFGAVIQTIPLRGTNATTVEQRVVTRPVIDTLAADGLLAFLTSRCAALAIYAADPAITAEGITITAISRALADPDATEPDPANPGWMRAVMYDATLGQELVEGTVTDWMRSNYAIRAQQQRLTFAFTLDRGSGEGGGGGVSAPLQAAVDFIATTAQTGRYTAIASYQEGDVVPSGLAAAYLQALAPLQFSGALTLVEEEAGTRVPAAGLGRVLNLAGSACGDWASMRALVVEEEVRVASGETVLTFGPAEHLRPADLVAALQTTRPGVGGRVGSGPGVLSTRSSASRVSGLPDPGGTVGLGVTSPVQNAVTLGGGDALTARQWNVTVNGQAAYCDFNSGLPQSTPTGTGDAVNPD